MRVIAKPALIQFWERFPDAEGSLKAWYGIMRQREYQNPNQLKAEFRNASLLGNGYSVFNIAGNKYRLLVHIRYDVGIVFIKRVLTHEEYDQLNAAGTLIERRNRNG